MRGVIGYVGLSHLGIVSSIATASKGFQVVAYDASETLCQQLSDGNFPVHEPGLPELLGDCREQILFTSNSQDLTQCDVVVFSLDIPTTPENESDLSKLDDLIDSVHDDLSEESVAVILSQLRPGYTRNLSRRIIGSNGPASLYYQVETLIFGRAVERATEPERFMVGCSDPQEPLPAAYAELLAAFDCPVLQMRYESAELAKTAINLFLVASVTTTNTLSEICESIGADWSEIQPALRLDRRIGQYAYLSPGLGIAGGNLERDLVTLKSLAAEGGTDAGIIDAFRNNSQHRSDWVLRTLKSELGSGKQTPTVAVWGLAYKQDTKSTKNSPSVALLDNLSFCNVRVYDPQAEWPGDKPEYLATCDNALDVCRQADALVIMTPWQEFSEVELSQVVAQMAGTVVIDPFGCLDAEQCQKLKLSHLKLGVSQNPSVSKSITGVAA